MSLSWIRRLPDLISFCFKQATVLNDWDGVNLGIIIWPTLAGSSILPKGCEMKSSKGKGSNSSKHSALRHTRPEREKPSEEAGLGLDDKRQPEISSSQPQDKVGTRLLAQVVRYKYPEIQNCSPGFQPRESKILAPLLHKLPSADILLSHSAFMTIIPLHWCVPRPVLAEQEFPLDTSQEWMLASLDRQRCLSQTNSPGKHRAGEGFSWEWDPRNFVF